MLKKGFTLQELLITMGIVGIVSAMVIPAVVNAMPDKNKTMYVKAYNTLTSETADILSDESLYWNTYDNNGEFANIGLFSSGQPRVSPYSNDAHCQGTTKFPAILSHRLNIKGTPTYTGANTTFMTNDGISWLFNTTVVAIIGGNRRGYKINVTINVNPSDNNASHNCVYSAACTKPNQFRFEIDNDGGVRAADALGIAYLQTSTDMHSSLDDKQLASAIVDSNLDKMYENLNKNLKATDKTTTKK